jgi:hypothetical protein
LSGFALIIIGFSIIAIFVYHFDEYSINTDDAVQENANRVNYFHTFGDSLWSIFTSISTSSMPNQVVPYYTDLRSSFIFFSAYLSMGTFVMLNLVLVFVLAEYEKSSQKVTLKKIQIRNENLQMAFRTLDVFKRGCLSYSQVHELLREVYHSYPEFRRDLSVVPSDSELALLVAALDVNGDNFIYEADFMWILHLADIVIEEKVRMVFVGGGEREFCFVFLQIHI